MIRFFSFHLLLIAASFAAAQTGPQAGYRIHHSTKIVVGDATDGAAAHYLNAFLQQHYGFVLPVAGRGEGIVLVTRRFVQAPDGDGYALTVTANGVRIEGDTQLGIFYGIGRLLSIFPRQANKNGVLVPYSSISEIKPEDSLTGPIRLHRAVGKNLRLITPPDRQLAGTDPFLLVDGRINRSGLRQPGQFIGFSSKEFCAILKLDSIQPVAELRLHGLFESSRFIYPPQLLTVYASTDGRNYTRMGAAREFVGVSTEKGFLAVVPERPVPARYLKLVAGAVGAISPRMPGAGRRALMFFDEIEVR